MLNRDFLNELFDKNAYYELYDSKAFSGYLKKVYEVIDNKYIFKILRKNNSEFIFIKYKDIKKIEVENEENEEDESDVYSDSYFKI